MVRSDGSDKNDGDGHQEFQLGDGYGCSCGFITDQKSKFTGHLMSANRKDGKGTHKSIGRVNLATGEVTMPPYMERTPEQLQQTYHGKKREKGDLTPEITTKKEKAEVTSRTTDILANASQIRFVPRIYTVDYTPLMRVAQEVATREWGWRSDMPLSNFIDTIFYIFFMEHGFKLGVYSKITEEGQEVPVGS